MAKPSAPAPPDPAQTAGAQVAQNIGTATAQQTLNNTNQVTPYGTLEYSQTGTTPWTDPNTGQTYQIPQYTAVQSLSETGQQIKGAQDRAAINLSDLAAEQTTRLGSLLGSDFDLSNDATEARLMELGRTRLDPVLSERREALETQLSNQGIKLGSEAFDRAMRNNSQAENDAYTSLLLGGRGQAVQEAVTARTQPINEIMALMNGGQVTQPNFMPSNAAQVANVDRAGLENAAYQSEVNAYNQQMAGRQSIMGGLFGLAAGGLQGGYF